MNTSIFISIIILNWIKLLSFYHYCTVVSSRDNPHSNWHLQSCMFIKLKYQYSWILYCAVLTKLNLSYLTYCNSILYIEIKLYYTGTICNTVSWDQVILYRYNMYVCIYVCISMYQYYSTVCMYVCMYVQYVRHPLTTVPVK